MAVINQRNVKEYLFEQTAVSFKGRAIKPTPQVHLYIVEMLNNFVTKSENENLIGSSISVKFMKNLQQSDPAKYRSVCKQLGDNCLVMLGLFYERIRNSGIDNVQLHNTIGINSYQGLGNVLNRRKKSIGDHFLKLGEQFVGLTEVISDLRLPEFDDSRKLFDLYQKWEKTKDSRYESILKISGINLYESKNLQ